MPANSTHDSAPTPPLLSLRVVYFLLCFSISLGGLWFADYRLINVDSAAILTVAREMLDGRPLYSDLFTSQVPLIFYLSMPPLFLHSLLSVSIPEAFFLYVFVLLQLCVLFSWHIARRGPLGRTEKQSYTLLITFYIALFILPLEINGSCFGQREHLFCALTLPYLILAINRLQGITDTRREQIAAGILAAIGFCIKPHFCIIFILSELFQMLALRRLFSWNRADVWTIVILSLCYYLLFLFLFPEYFGLIPRFVTDYSASEIPWPIIVLMALPPVIPAVLYACCMCRTAEILVICFLLTLTGGSAILFILPRLPFFYHAIPLYFFSLLLFALSMIAAERITSAFIIIGLFIFYIFYVPLEPPHPDAKMITALRDEMLKDVILLAPYKTIASLNTEARIQPIISYTGAKWVMCMPYLEYIPAAYSKWRFNVTEPPYHALQDMDENERYFHEKVIRDLQQLPDAIIVDESPSKTWLGTMKFDFLHYFMKDTRFQEIWKHYELVTRISRPFETSAHWHNSDAAIYRRKD